MAIELDWEKSGDGLVLALTGAGISAESGIPTFRGEEGYWTVGSREYRPEEMATFAMYSRNPDEVWQWYLYRRTVCRAADPNPAHDALVTLEQTMGDRFRLITQNVSNPNLYQITTGLQRERSPIDGTLLRCLLELFFEHPGLQLFSSVSHNEFADVSNKNLHIHPGVVFRAPTVER